ncbi:MAG: sulfatase-like hydrolase/transferase [Opitutaceae bacterium]|nr:sulfatase-like hydrolase/transferase [Opitutaceae bacterium]
MKSLRLFSPIALSAFLFVASAAAASRPNILLIVSDDQGYADVGFHGSKEVPTPHLDRLAAGGVVFTHGYVSHPFCSPTRAGLLTGRYQHRFGHENNPFYDPADKREGLPLSEKLLPEYLRAAGYATGWIGKWHLGATPEHKPSRRGFAETFGFIGGGHRFTNWSPNIATEYLVPIERNDAPVEVKEHLTTALGREAAAFVTRHRAAPWFLYLAFNAPHSPNEPTPERLARFASIADPKRRAYVAQVSLMDDAIGDTLAALRASGQEERTLVFFFSDNGGPIGPNSSMNTPLRDAKGTVYEGGVRVPFVVRWPEKVKAGARFEPAASSLDVFTTTLAAAGVPPPNDRVRDSVDLVPFLTGEKKGEPHAALFWRAQRGQWAVRTGAEGWKLVRQAGKPDELYKLSVDPAETTDLAAKEPARVAALSAQIAEWDKQMIPPVFGGLAARNDAKAAKKKAKTGKE